MVVCLSVKVHFFMSKSTVNHLFCLYSILHQDCICNPYLHGLAEYWIFSSVQCAYRYSSVLPHSVFCVCLRAHLSVNVLVCLLVSCATVKTLPLLFPRASWYFPTCMHVLLRSPAPVSALRYRGIFALISFVIPPPSSPFSTSLESEL
jgi:hypothetical protein